MKPAKPLPPKLVLLALALLAAAPAAADLQAAGPPLLAGLDDTCFIEHSDAAPLPDGGLAIAWSERQDGSGFFPGRFVLRLADADGTPRGEPLVVAEGVDAGYAPAVAATGDGAAVLWYDDAAGELRLSRYSTTGEFLDTLTVVAEPGILSAGLATHADGRALVVWVRLGVVSFRFVDLASGALSPVEQLSSGGFQEPPEIGTDADGFYVLIDSHLQGDVSVDGRLLRHADGTTTVEHFPTSDGRHASPFGSGLATDGDGNAVVTFGNAGSPATLHARFYSAGGTPRRLAVQVAGDGWTFETTVAALDGDGYAHVAWIGQPADGTHDDRAVWVQSFAPSGLAAGPPRRLADAPVFAGELTLDAVGGDRLLLSWFEGENTLAAGPLPFCWGDSLRLLPVARRDEPQPLLLGGGRFRVEVTWNDPYNGPRSGAGRPVPLTDDSGWFWFFHPGNAELVVKVLDGSAINGHYWVFYGGLTTVEWTMTVRDQVTGNEALYHNPPFIQASHGDTKALPATVPVAFAAPAPSRFTAAAPQIVDPNAAGGPCTPFELLMPRRPGLCLHGRFEVEVAWQDVYNGGSGTAWDTLISTYSGFLWFFRPSNAEIFVKILDGRPYNGHWWLFAGSLTDLPYTLTVHDTQADTTKVFENDARTFRSFQDVRLFAEPAAP